MIFGITEDLGGGLSGIAQLDARFAPDDAGGNFAESGNTWVGVRSASMGTLTFGRHDLHYGKQPDDTAALAGSLQAAAVSLMDFINGGAVANATRTSNVVRYDTPNWSGFAATVAYSTNGAAGTEADLTTGLRKGSAWNFNPSSPSGPFQVGFSHWRSKADGVDVEQTSNSLYGFYRFGAFKVGLGYNQAENELAGVTTGDRNAWTIPVTWTAGQHHVAGHYTKAGENDAVAGEDGAKMMAIAYSYLLSKRTAMGVTFAKITNDGTSAYNFFTNTQTGATTAGLGSTGSALGAGEDGRLVAFTVRHAF